MVQGQRAQGPRLGEGDGRGRQGRERRLRGGRGVPAVGLLRAEEGVRCRRQEASLAQVSELGFWNFGKCHDYTLYPV